MKNLLLKSSSLNTDLATLIIRLLFGGLFAYYGLSKIQQYDAIAPNFPDLIGIGGKLSFILVIIAEFGGGILIVLGLFTRLAVIPILITMIVAYFLAHANDPFTAKQIAFVYMILCPAIFLLGGGKYSLDKALFK